jgi:hypothetical protein
LHWIRKSAPTKSSAKSTATQFGESFEAVDQTNKKKVGLKCLRPKIATPRNSWLVFTQKQEYWLFGFVCRGEQTYLVMESVEGETLESKSAFGDRT